MDAADGKLSSKKRGTQDGTLHLSNKKKRRKERSGDGQDWRMMGYMMGNQYQQMMGNQQMGNGGMFGVGNIPLPLDPGAAGKKVGYFIACQLQVLCINYHDSLQIVELNLLVLSPSFYTMPKALQQQILSGLGAIGKCFHCFLCSHNTFMLNWILHVVDQAWAFVRTWVACPDSIPIKEREDRMLWQQPQAVPSDY